MDSQLEKRWHNMIVAAFVDHKVSPTEVAYLERVRVELGIPEKDAQAIADEVTHGKEQLYLGGTREEQEESFREIIHVLLVDGELDEREKKVIKAIASHINMPQDELQTFVKSCRVSLQKELGTPAATKPANAATYQEPPREGDIRVHQPSGLECVLVPGGRFTFGNMSVGNVCPNTSVTSFAIGRFPVTNAQWERFEKETGHAGRVVPQEAWFLELKRPVVGVSYDDALAFCAWAGVRLPTETEWEFCARGSDGRDFPWGENFPNHDIANFGQNLLDRNHAGPNLVGAYPAGVSPFGAYDMIGNVAEWCTPTGKCLEDNAPTRGGHWLAAVYALPSYYHYMMSRHTRVNYIGFRVAVDASALE